MARCCIINGESEGSTMGGMLHIILHVNKDIKKYNNMIKMTVLGLEFNLKV